MYGFLTGSHAYGTPNDKSDVDLAVFVPEPDFGTFQRLNYLAERRGKEGGDYPEGTACFRFDRLNLLVFKDELQFDAWRVATAELIARKPVTRFDAAKHIDQRINQAEADFAAGVERIISGDEVTA